MGNDRLGLCMVAASLLVVCTVGALLARHERASRVADTRRQGLALASLIARTPAEGLLNEAQEVLQIVAAHGNPDFAYAVIVDPEHRALAKTEVPGAVIPQRALTAEPASWIGESELRAPGSGRPLREFVAPVIVAGEAVAHVRLGFFDPGYGFLVERMSFLAMLALPIFLLTPLSYTLLRREIQPLASASRELEESFARGDLQALPVAAGGPAGQLLRSLNRFVGLLEQRLEEVQIQRTELVASSRVVAYQKGRLEAVLDSLSDAVVLLGPEGRVAFANARLETLLGVAPSRALGQPPDAWCPSAEAIRLFARHTGAAARRRRAESVEFHPENAPERSIAALALPVVVPGNDPSLDGTVAVFRDVTEHVLARRAQGEFASHVAHELKSPLHVIAMYAESLLGKDGESESFRIDSCNVIQDEVERLGTLVSTLLTIARLEAGDVSLDRQRVRLADFLRDTLDSASRGGKLAGLHFSLQAPPDLSPVHVDKELLRVAITNLLTNAIKYNAEGGSVALSAEETAERIVIRVRDTGIGIAEEDQKRVFEKFFRADNDQTRARTGHGLGLALVRDVVELHGGEVRLESAVGEGSQFSIVFPKSGVLIRETR